MRYGLTRPQRDLLAFIRARVEGDGVGPSYDEMAEFLGTRSRSGLHRLVSGLVERGALVKMPRRSRAISLPAAPLALSEEQIKEIRYGARVRGITPEEYLRDAIIVPTTPPVFERRHA